MEDKFLKVEIGIEVNPGDSDKISKLLSFIDNDLGKLIEDLGLKLDKKYCKMSISKSKIYNATMEV